MFICIIWLKFIENKIFRINMAKNKIKNNRMV
jgi:hypothetical protein